MRLPNIAQIKEIHEKSIARFGGVNGIMKLDQLEGFEDGMSLALYLGKKDIIGLAAWILVRLVQNHYFVDGNKRTALGTMLNFLLSNNCKWNLPDNNFFLRLTLYIASNHDEDIIMDIEMELREVVVCS